MNWLLIAISLLIIAAILRVASTVMFKQEPDKKIKWQFISQALVILALIFNAVVAFYLDEFYFATCIFVLLTQILLFLTKWRVIKASKTSI